MAAKRRAEAEEPQNIGIMDQRVDELAAMRMQATSRRQQSVREAREKAGKEVRSSRV